MGSGRAYSAAIDIGGVEGEWTTANFIDWLRERGAFSHPYWVCRGSWTYARNRTITDTECGHINLTGAVVEVFGNDGNHTLRVTTPSTAPRPDHYENSQFTYVFNGTDYFPGWRRDYNTRHRPTAADIGALTKKDADSHNVRQGSSGVVYKNDDLAWNSPTGAYLKDNGPHSSLIWHMGLNSGSASAAQFYFDFANGGIKYRSSRDNSGFEKPWARIYTDQDKPTPADIGALTDELASQKYAKLNSPGLTGHPTAPTPVIGTSSNQIATTEFVNIVATENSAKYALLDFGVVTRQSRYVLENPFGNNTPVIVRAEIKINNKWSYPGFIFSNSGGWGVEGTYVEGEGIIVQVGNASVSATSFHGGSGNPSNGDGISAPCRVHVWKP